MEIELIFHRSPTSLFSLHKELSQKKLHFYGGEKKGNMKIKLITRRVLYLKAPKVIQKNRKSKRFKMSYPLPLL